MREQSEPALLFERAALHTPAHVQKKEQAKKEGGTSHFCLHKPLGQNITGKLRI